MTFVVTVAALGAACTLSLQDAVACGGPWDVACNIGAAVEKGAQDAGAAIEKGVQDAGTAIEKGVQDAGVAIEVGVQDAGNTVEKTLHDAGHTIEIAAQDVGQTGEKALHDTGHALEKAGQDIGHFLEQAVDFNLSCELPSSKPAELGEAYRNQCSGQFSTYQSDIDVCNNVGGASVIAAGTAATLLSAVKSAGATYVLAKIAFETCEVACRSQANLNQCVASVDSQATQLAEKSDQAQAANDYLQELLKCQDDAYGAKIMLMADSILAQCEAEENCNTASDQFNEEFAQKVEALRAGIEVEREQARSNLTQGSSAKNDFGPFIQSEILKSIRVGAADGDRLICRAEQSPIILKAQLQNDNAVKVRWIREGVQAQGTLEYRFGPPSDGPGGQQSGRSINDGINMLGSGSYYGTVAGEIGTSIPLPETSEQRLAYEAARRAALVDSTVAPLPLDQPSRYLEAYNTRRYLETDDPNYLRAWKTTDDHVKRQLAETFFELKNVSVANTQMAILRSTGQQAIVDADSHYAEGQLEEAVFLASVGKAAADLLVGIDPITGALRGVYEAVTGSNLITGEELGDFERGLAVVNVVTLGYGGKVEKGVELLSRAGKAARGLVSGSRVLAHAQQISMALYGKLPWVVRAGKDRRAIEILTHASSGPLLRRDLIGQVSSTYAERINFRAPELFALNIPVVYNGYAGRLTRGEMNRIGMAFVGDDAIPFVDRFGDIIGFRSVDGLRGYRLPADKQLYGLQANLETFAPKAAGRTKELSDVHIDIVE
ncbi:hypothetical protein JKP88DRAFT_255868 [Tribonema minus]|uniref:Pre-toxin TG domain-containing protein n=1 Tax=Tribonema minus TaxID=303371 RepID=A0A835Z6T5_9STRA|nr:hypothetical protein JKP88DRAFT_255868 [Tribonema minus]